MALLGKDQIMQADDIKTEDVPVPEWGGTVRIKGLTGTERDDYEASCMTILPDGHAEPYPLNMRAKLVARSIVDEEGKRLFSDEEAVTLGEKSSLALDRLFDKAQKLSGLTEDDVKVLEGNSGAASSGDSISS